MTTEYKIGTKYKVFAKDSKEEMFEGYLLFEEDGSLFFHNSPNGKHDECTGYWKRSYEFKETPKMKPKTKLEEYLEKHGELQKLKAAAQADLKINARSLRRSIIANVNEYEECDELSILLNGTVCIDFVLDSGKFETVFKDADDDTWLITPEQFEQWKSICLNWKALTS